MQLTLKVTDTATRNLKIAPFKLRKGIDGGIKESMERIKTRMQANIRSRFRTKTGRATRSIKTRGPWTLKGNKIVGRVGSFYKGKGITADTRADYYLKTHEYGKTIRPRKAAYLAIPQPDGTIRMVKSARIPARPWFRPAIKPQSVLGSIMKHLRRALRFK